MEGELRYQAGEKIGGRYLVHQALAGGMGEVYLCLDTEEMYPVALKTFQVHRDDVAQQQQMRRLFAEEVSHWVALGKHPHIVRCFYMDTLDNQPFMVLEWIGVEASLGSREARSGTNSGADTNAAISGPDLRGRLRSGPLPLKLALQFALDLCSGLAYAAEKQPGIVHRDLKPDNVLIAQGDIAKITDWGLATLVARAELNLSEGEEDVAKSVAGTGPEWNHTGARPSLLLHKGAVGTPPYMAPEQWRGEELDARADLYAVGCILFEMLTGSWPYRASSAAGFEQAHCSGAVPLLPASFPSAVRAVVARCLSKARAERYASAAELGVVLSGVYADVVREAARVLAVGGEFDAQDYNNRGITYDRLGQHERAIADYNQALNLEPDYAIFYHNRGSAYSKLDQHERAIEDYDKAIALNPNLAEAYSNRGSAYTSLGHHEQALKDHDKAVALKPDYDNAYYSRGLAYNNQGQFEQAVKDYDKAIALNPDYAEAYYNRGTAYGNLGQSRQALMDFDQAIILRPDLAIAYYDRGNSYARLGQYVRAVKDFDQVVALEPDFAPAYSNRGAAYAELGQFERAIENYDQAILLQPDYVIAYRNRGNDYANMGQFERAVKDYDKAIALNPDYAEAYYNRGTAYGNLGQFEQAIENYDQAIFLQPDYAIAHFNKGAIFSNTGRLTEALLCFEKAARLGNSTATQYAAQVRQRLGLR